MTSIIEVKAFQKIPMRNISSSDASVFDCTNKCHSDYFLCLRSVIWIGLDLENWTHVQLCCTNSCGVFVFLETTCIILIVA